MLKIMFFVNKIVLCIYGVYIDDVMIESGI